MHLKILSFLVYQFVTELVPISSPDDDRIVLPVSFAKGNVEMLRARIQSLQALTVTPGFLQMGAYDKYGFPYPLCPGVK